MPIITLLEKAYGSYTPETFEPFFKSLCNGLEVQTKVVGRTDRGWIQVKITGEDSSVASRFLDQEIGLAPVSSEKLRKFSTAWGRIVSSRKSKEELRVDIGVFSPRILDAKIPLQRLHAQLTDGKKLALRKIVELYCLYDNVSLNIKLTGKTNTEEGSFEAEFSEGQLSEFSRWIGTFLDRLVILGASLSDVERAVKISKLTRDIVRVEQLGFLEHTCLCKLGTDAVGLIPKLGRYLRKAILAPFSPKKIQTVIDRSPL